MGIQKSRADWLLPNKLASMLLSANFLSPWGGLLWGREEGRRSPMERGGIDVIEVIIGVAGSNRSRAGRKNHRASPWMLYVWEICGPTFSHIHYILKFLAKLKRHQWLVLNLQNAVLGAWILIGFRLIDGSSYSQPDVNSCSLYQVQSIIKFYGSL